MLLCLYIEYKRGAVNMHTGADIKLSGDWVRSGDNIETWTCGCTVIGGISPINARCMTCGGVFKKVPKKKSGYRKGKLENVKMELINSAPPLFNEPEIEEAEPCQHCDSVGEIKVFTQEWDRIKSHLAPCPQCYSQEWLDWSAGRRIIENK